MKQVKNLSEVVNAIDNKLDLYEMINGHKYKVDTIRLLQNTFINVLSQIKNGTLYIDYEY